MTKLSSSGEVVLTRSDIRSFFGVILLSFGSSVILMPEPPELPSSQCHLDGNGGIWTKGTDDFSGYTVVTVVVVVVVIVVVVEV